MKTSFALLAGVVFSLVAGCVTEFKSYEPKNNVFEGKGGTKVVVDGMEFWDRGEPPRKFTVLGIIVDRRHPGPVPMAELRRDVVTKAREAGGDAVIQLGAESLITGYQGAPSAPAIIPPWRRNVGEFAVIRYVD